MERIQENPFYKELSLRLHPQDFEVLKQILNNYEFDLCPNHGYFEAKVFEQICQKSIDVFFEAIKNKNIEHLDGEDLRYIWSEIINDYQKNYWGFKKLLNKPSDYKAPTSLNLHMKSSQEIPKKPAIKIDYKDSFFYIWSVLQAMIITKALILVFGNQLAKDDSMKNRVLFGLVIVFSFGSLFYFAWKRRKNPK
jgi:hypothetical protein